MKELNSLIQEGIIIIKNYSSKEDLLNSISDLLISKEYVTPEFKEEILKREYQFPTGLVTRTINVSIPHSEAEYVIKESIIIVIHPEKVAFTRMDSPGEEIEVEVSFVLLLKDKNRHIRVLQQLAQLLQWEGLHKIRNCSTKEDVEQLLKGVSVND